MAALEPTTDHEEIRRWATRHGAVPTEVLPHIVDGEPALLRFLVQDQVKDRKDCRLIAWDEFFLKFDSLGLTFVYDDGATGQNEILQIEERSPYRHPAYRTYRFDN